MEGEKKPDDFPDRSSGLNQIASLKAAGTFNGPVRAHFVVVLMAGLLRKNEVQTLAPLSCQREGVLDRFGRTQPLGLAILD